MKKHFSFTSFNAVNSIPPLLKDGLIISVIIHIFILTLIMITPHIQLNVFLPKHGENEPIIIDLDNVIVSKKTILPPAPSKEIKANTTPKKSSDYNAPIEQKVVAKEQVQEKEVATANTKSESSDLITETQTKSKNEPKQKIDEKQKNLVEERIGSLNDLLASVDGIKQEKEKKQKEEVFSEVKKGISASVIDTKTQSYQENSTADYLRKQLSISYIDAIRIKLRSCWNIDPGAKDIKNMKIVIKTTIAPDGNINDIEILNQDSNSSPSFIAVAESARRALIVCNPYNLPAEYYQDWKNIIFTFYPDKQSVQ